LTLTISIRDLTAKPATTELDELLRSEREAETEDRLFKALAALRRLQAARQSRGDSGAPLKKTRQSCTSGKFMLVGGFKPPQ